MWQSIAILPWGAWLIPKPYVFLLCRIIKVFKKKGENPRIDISVDWLNVKWLHYRHSKIVKWLNQTKHTLRGSPRRDSQKDRMRSHESSRLLERDSQSVFSTKWKKKAKNQIKIKITKIGKECHEHCTTFHYIASLHTKSAFIAFQDKGCMHLHP